MPIRNEHRIAAALRESFISTRGWYSPYAAERGTSAFYESSSIAPTAIVLPIPSFAISHLVHFPA
ncbi:hypothetical protein V1502_03480 [Bacillus sp. SCS-153A]|uniref:hypothetical protein n=1 Tax=Rossellomorea sedimentorum TaxID=3115294 RepID=UPI003906A56A